MKFLSLLVFLCAACATLAQANAASASAAAVTHPVKAPAPSASAAASASTTVAPAYAFAATISDADAGTYMGLDQDDKPTGHQYRLSRSKGKWKLEGKAPNASWKDLGCGAKCEYKPSTIHEIRAMFPSGWVANADIGCIQDASHAFCHFLTRIKEGKNGFVYVTIEKEQSMPHFLKKETPSK